MTVTTVRSSLRRVEVGDLARLAKEVEGLEKQVKSLIDVVRKTYGQGHLAGLIDSLFAAYRPPEPPHTKTLAEAAEGLERYRHELKSYLDQISELVSQLENIARLEHRLTSRLEELKQWADSLERISPYHAAEAKKLVSKCMRALDQIPQDHPSRTVSNLLAVSEEVQTAIRSFRALVDRRLQELEGQVASLKHALNRARHLASVEEQGEISRIAALIRGVRAEIDKTRAEMPSYIMDIRLWSKRVSEAFEYVKGIVSKSLSHEEVEVLKELGRLSKATDGKHIPLHSLAERLAHSTGLPVRDVYAVIHGLSKKHLVKVHVRILE